jgi:hypothetical protein
VQEEILMPKRSVRIICILFAFLHCCICIYAQESKIEKPNKLTDYRIVQYISQRGYSPISITRLDNNGDILLACRSPKTKEQLIEMGINITDSQLRLLEIYKLLAKNNKAYKTAFPILGPEQTAQLRKYSKDVSENLIEDIKPDVIELVNNLKKIGREKNSYSILFAYIFDGMSWSEFELKGLVHSTSIDIKNPFWAGEVYAFYPDRRFTSGTNTWTKDSSALKINWSRYANPFLSPFYKEIKKIDNQSFAHMLKNGIVEDENIRNGLSPYGILDTGGRITIPIIDESENNIIYSNSKKIAKKMTANTLNLISFDDIKSEFNLRDINQAIIIFYHELIWDLMESLEEQGIVKKPVAFTDDKSVTAKDVADLMFIVRSQ